MLFAPSQTPPKERPLTLIEQGHMIQSKEISTKTSYVASGIKPPVQVTVKNKFLLLKLHRSGNIRDQSIPFL